MEKYKQPVLALGLAVLKRQLLSSFLQICSLLRLPAAPSSVLCPLVEKAGSAGGAPACSLLKDKSHFAEYGRYPYVGDGKCLNLSPLPQGCLSSCLQQTLLCPFSVGHMIEAPKMIAKGLQKLPTKDISVAMGPRTLISFAGESQSFEAMDEKCGKQC